jgi:hypothetical protein
MRDVFVWAALCCLISSTADDAANVSRVDAWSSFRPFKANNTEAYAFPEWVGSQIAPRDARMTDAACRGKVMAAAKGIEWNPVGCSFPASWRYDSAAFSTLKNYTLLSGNPYQRATEEIMLEHDHLREDMTQHSDNTLLQQLKRDGFATIGDWGLSPQFVDALASEAFAKLDEAERIAKNKAVVSTNAILETLETVQGKLFWQNSSLLSAAVRYLGPDAELAGYEALRLTNELNSVTQYRSGQWHHDRCGARLKAFLFLHDTRSRPTQVARGSHKTLYWSYHDMGESRFSDDWVARNYDIVSMGGPKGGGFVFDTNALHRGVLKGDAPRSVLILEFNDAAKDADLARAAATFRSKHPTKAFPCPSGAQHVLRRSARDLLMRQSTRRRRVAGD